MSKSELAIRYETTAITYATQFMISASDDEIVLDCSSGAVFDEDGKGVLPVHSRLAVSWNSARRLASLLNQAVERKDRTNNGDEPRGARKTARAELPALKNVYVEK